MKRFDVFRLNNSKQSIVVNLQSDLHGSYLDSIIAAPISSHSYYDGKFMKRLFVPVELDKKSYVIVLPQLAMISKKRIGVCIGSLASYQLEITQSLDFLFQGF